jgi:hypothetical protein
MADPNELAALQAAFRGAVDTAERLAGLGARVAAGDQAGEIDPGLLEELSRVTAAHAIASAALRGIVESMQRRRSPPG